MARLRSTGLGKTEIQAHITKLRVDQDLLVMEMQTTKPVRWHVRVGLHPEDRLKLVKFLFKLNFKLLRFVFNWNSNKEKPSQLTDF
jgi:hypothetical protein